MASPLVRVPSLDLLRGFVAVGRRMSITQAADDLCLTQSAISKQVRALEESLGVQLLERGYRKVSFTEAGHRLFVAADASVSSLMEVLGSIASQGRKPVTVTASIGVTGLWLLPRLAEFRERHPDIDVRIDANNSVIDLDLEGVDLAIRYCAERNAPLGAVALFGETMGPVKCPRLALDGLDAESISRTVLLEYEDLRHPWLRWTDWLESRKLRLKDAKGVLRFNQYDQLIHAAAAGQGVAMGRLGLLSAWLSSGQLQCVGDEGDALPTSHAYWLVKGGTSSPDVDTVLHWILREARRPVAA